MTLSIASTQVTMMMTLSKSVDPDHGIVGHAWSAAHDDDDDGDNDKDLYLQLSKTKKSRGRKGNLELESLRRVFTYRWKRILNLSICS